MSKSVHEIIRENIKSDNIANLRKLDEQGWFQDLYTKGNLVERNRKDQEIYKQAFYNFIGNAEATDGMDEQKPMLKASATGTAADIDLFIANKQKAENKFWLKNLDVALHFGNDATAQALIKHGAEIKPEYVQVAEKYTSEATVDALREAQLKQT